MNNDKLGRQVRTQWVNGLNKDLSGIDSLVVAQLQKVGTRDLNQLRLQLESQNGSFSVVKNALCRIAFREKGWTSLEGLLQGTCAITPIRGDAATACKLLVQFAKDHEGFVLKGGVVGGDVLQPQDLSALARLPSRQVLLGQIAGGLQAPIVGLVCGLSGILRQLVGVLDAI